MSVKFYNENAEDFYNGTVEADMSKTYSIFESYLSLGDHILDLGCGSGRDSLHFLYKGYSVTSFDYSEEMVKRASELTGQKVIHGDMLKMDYVNQFDAIWACASILHIPSKDISNALKKCYSSLKKDGIIYMSFKYGEGEVSKGGRHFSNFTEDSFSEVLKKLNLFELKKYWKTADVRPERENEKWLNIIIKAKKF